MKIQRPAGTETAERETLCPDCGTAHTADGSSDPRCEECRPAERRHYERDRGRGKTAERGYGYAWQQLSKRARALQDFCTDCGSPEDLTADHSVTAWERHAAGKVIRLQDIDVVCNRCNTERGAARGEGATDEYRLTDRERFARIESDPDL